MAQTTSDSMRAIYRREDAASEIRNTFARVLARFEGDAEERMLVVRSIKRIAQELEE